MPRGRKGQPSCHVPHIGPLSGHFGLGCGSWGFLMLLGSCPPGMPGDRLLHLASPGDMPLLSRTACSLLDDLASGFHPACTVLCITWEGCTH